MSQKLTYLVAGIFMLACISCSKNENEMECLIIRSSFNGNPYDEYIYSNNRLIRANHFYDNGQASKYLIYQRDSYGNIESVYDYNASGQLYSKVVLAYNTDDKIGQIFFYLDMDGDGYAENLKAKHSYTFEEGTFHPLLGIYETYGPYTESVFIYTWTGGNLTRIEAVDQGYTNYSYDAGRNMYTGMPDEFFFAFTNPSNMIVYSENNITAAHVYDTAGIFQYSNTMTYTYNEGGYVDSKTSNASGSVTTYEYSCTED